MEEIIALLEKRNNEETFLKGDFPRLTPKEGNILFVDGGNAELLGGPDCSIHFIRVAGIIFRGKEKKGREISECYAMFYTAMENEKIVVKTKITHLKGKTLLDEKKLVFHLSQNNISGFADIVRRIAEIGLACKIAENLEQESSVVLDGSLETRFDTEKYCMDKLKEVSMSKKLNLCALSKTTSMISRTGTSLPILAKRAMPESCCYVKISESEIQTHLVKLHPSSEFVFRCDAMPSSVPEIFSQLSFISKDPVFLGYPYGLIEADKLARVSNREKEMLRLEIAARTGSRWKGLEDTEIAVKAHQILDNIQ